MSAIGMVEFDPAINPAKYEVSGCALNSLARKRLLPEAQRLTSGISPRPLLRSAPPGAWLGHADHQHRARCPGEARGRAGLDGLHAAQYQELGEPPPEPTSLEAKVEFVPRTPDVSSPLLNPSPGGLQQLLRPVHVGRAVHHVKLHQQRRRPRRHRPHAVVPRQDHPD